MIHVNTIISAVKELCVESNCDLGVDCVKAIKSAYRKESKKLPKEILSQIIQNIKIAKVDHLPVCQDTGIAVIFAELGQEVKIEGGSLSSAINEGVRQGYKEGYLRKSVVGDPLRRENTKDNTPCVIHYDVVPGNSLKITVMPKGAGSENMSRIKMFNPHAGVEAVEGFVVETVKNAGANPCPPVIVGVGIGGNFEKSAILSKKALVRSIGERNSDKYYAYLEKRLLKKINQLGVGPMGVGGKGTALDVFVEQYPCHIASLPVAVNIQCWVARHRSAVLK